MEKEKLVHYVPADMVDRLKKLLVRLWETRNPAAAQLGDLLRELEPEIKSLNDAIFDISSRERNTAIRDKEKGWAAERESLRAESERGLEELRAASAARLEMIKASFASEKAGLSGDLAKARKEIEDLKAEYRRVSDNLAAKDGELEKRLFEARSEFERESGRRVQETVEEITGRLLASLKEAEKRNEEAAAETARAKEESAGLRAALAERARQSGERHEWQAAEAAARDRYLASEHEKVLELESRISALNDEHRAELAGKLRVQEDGFRQRLQESESEKDSYLKVIADLKARFEGAKGEWEAECDRIKARAGKRYAELEASLDARAAERLEIERAAWEAQNRRRESLLTGAAEDFQKARKEIEVLTAENRRVNDALAEMARSGKFRNEAQFDEAVARERGRAAADYAGRLAALEAGTKEQLAAYSAKEKNWAVEKERYESELALCSVSTRSFIAEQERKLKADLAKWKEALEEEYKERLAEQLRARDVLLISEKARLTQEFMEKYAALEAKLESLRTGLGPKAGKPPEGKKKRGA